jgi:hypothetical protein
VAGGLAAVAHLRPAPVGPVRAGGRVAEAEQIHVHVGAALGVGPRLGRKPPGKLGLGPLQLRMARRPARRHRRRLGAGLLGRRDGAAEPAGLPVGLLRQPPPAAVLLQVQGGQQVHGGLDDPAGGVPLGQQRRWLQRGQLHGGGHRDHPPEGSAGGSSRSATRSPRHS